MIKIILAEADGDMRLILNQILIDAGYNVRSFPEGAAIINRQLEEWPDIFILDQEIPTIDGIALSKFLKANTKIEKHSHHNDFYLSRTKEARCEKWCE